MPARSLNRAEEDLLRDFFSRATEAGIPWLLMRNYEGFPREVGNDIDVFFPRSAFRRAASTFRAVLAEHGGEVLHRHQRDYVMALWFRLPGGAPLHLDFYHGVTTWHGLHYLTEDELWQERRQHEGWPVPRAAHEAMTLLVTSVLWGGFYKARYSARIAQLLAQPGEREVFESCMARAFGPAAELPFDPATAKEDRERDSAWGRRLQDGLRRGWRHRDRWTSWWRQARYWSGELATLIHPPAPCLWVDDCDTPEESRALDGLIREASGLFGGVFRLDFHPGLSSWKTWFRTVRVRQAKDTLVLVCVSAGTSVGSGVVARADLRLPTAAGKEVWVNMLLENLRTRSS